MKIKKTNRLFKNFSENKIGGQTNAEKFKQNLEEKQNIPKDSLAPNIILITKNKWYFGYLMVFAILLIASVYLYVDKFLFIKNFRYYFIALVITLGLILYKYRFASFLPKSKPFIIFSKDGISILKNDNWRLIGWNEISKLYLVSNSEGPDLLMIVKSKKTIQINLAGGNYDKLELSYLLKVYHNRHTNNTVDLLAQYENKYLRLDENKREQYTL